jgi:hypothetical protein
MDAFPDGLEPVRDLAPAAWVRDALADWPAGPFLVRDLVPPVFEAYARILHQTQMADQGGIRTGTWAQRAVQLGRELGPETTWWEMLGSSYRDARDEWTPEEGRLDEAEVSKLVTLLEEQTDGASAWFGLWSGFGFLTPGGARSLRASETLRDRWAIRRIRRAERKADRDAKRALARLPTFELLGHSGRAYLLIHGAIEDAQRFRFAGWLQSPTLWWPDDRSWFVHTEIDGMSTYLGGSRRLVDRLVGEQLLESFEVRPDSPAAL